MYIVQQKKLTETNLADELEKIKFLGMERAEIVDWVISSKIVNTVDSFQVQKVVTPTLLTVSLPFTIGPRGRVCLHFGSQIG